MYVPTKAGNENIDTYTLTAVLLALQKEHIAKSRLKVLSMFMIQPNPSRDRVQDITAINLPIDRSATPFYLAAYYLNPEHSVLSKLNSYTVIPLFLPRPPSTGSRATE